MIAVSVGPSRRALARVQGRDRHAQADRAAVEEGDLRRRRGVGAVKGRGAARDGRRFRAYDRQPMSITPDDRATPPDAVDRRHEEPSARRWSTPAHAARCSRSCSPRSPLRSGCCAEVRRLRAQVLRDLHRRRRLHADLGLAVRGRLRAADPGPRARALHRGEASGAGSAAPGVHPVPRRVRRASQQRASIRGSTRASRSPGRSPVGGAARLPRARAGDRLGSAARARVHGVPPQPVQPHPGLDPRRRPRLRVVEDPERRRRASNPAEARRLAGVVAALSLATAALALGMVVAHVPQNRL